MLAKIDKIDAGYTAEFERPFGTSKEKLWSFLISNENFKFWMDHLEITDLSKGGNINFHYNDGSEKLEKMTIIDYQEGQVLEFEWGEGAVRFEVHENEGGSKLILKESLAKITDHTAKDLAGWHVCLIRFSKALNGEDNPIPEEEWEKWYAEYKLLVENSI
ncbi:activator of Hsp90 ATPase 1 family protein [Lysinibacillus yapensis]|uniref:Activator of Hsp90 ATPase 1 family protein n=1 Tax=Ureibacillus yapensis TaxID=2304605 RepID=A0A396SBA8_9BACL|nr:SRPBCC family protein [Lysinibacillus yapensis]RHW38412.1 activator of Hsp90 ATPase 1 family protein [Lysinibacillus yapensis]